MRIPLHEQFDDAAPTCGLVFNVGVATDPLDNAAVAADSLIIVGVATMGINEDRSSG
jgi:hypothetical protein